MNKIRYAQGQIQITLPNFIGQGQKIMGNDGYAVTVDDIIVFNSDPSNSSLNHWAHEIYHVVQYTQRGIDAFAFDYLKDLGRSIENEAVGRANQITDSQISPVQNYLTAKPLMLYKWNE